MLRDTRRAFIFVDRGQDEKDKCEDQDGAIWYDFDEVCLRMFWATYKGKGTGGQNLVKKVDDDILDKLKGKPYNLDLLEAYSNAYNCWKDAGGFPDHPDTEQEVMEGDVPQCFFGMNVVSGKWEKNGVASDGVIRMDDWLGQAEDDSWSPDDALV